MKKQNNTSKKYSIIIPVYNAETKIEKCIESILLTSEAKLEIILVDDGSTDNSLFICQKMAQTFDQIHVFHIENHGVSYARNFGLKKASGKWVMFVDADDQIAKDTFLILNQYIKKNTAETYCWNALSVHDGISRTLSNIRPQQKLYFGRDIKLLIDDLYIKCNKDYYTGDLFRASWGKLYSMNIIKKYCITFPIGIKIGEDALFLIDYLSKTKSVFIFNKPLYLYNISAYSATGAYKEHYERIQLAEMREMRKKFIKNNLDPSEAIISFSHTCADDYFNNALKRTKNIFWVGKEMKYFLKETEFKEYLCNYVGPGDYNQIFKSFLVKFHMYNIYVIYIYIVKLLKKLNIIKR